MQSQSKPLDTMTEVLELFYRDECITCHRLFRTSMRVYTHPYLGPGFRSPLLDALDKRYDPDQANVATSDELQQRKRHTEKRMRRYYLRTPFLDPMCTI